MIAKCVSAPRGPLIHNIILQVKLFTSTNLLQSRAFPLTLCGARSTEALVKSSATLHIVLILVLHNSWYHADL